MSGFEGRGRGGAGGRGGGSGGRGNDGGRGRGNDGGRGGRGGRGDGGGRGGGGRGDSGGRGGGGGGSFGGKNRHMGEVFSITALANPSSVGMSDSSILSVINPSAADRANREKWVKEGAVTMPVHAPWRMSIKIGKEVPAGANGSVLSNHFVVNAAKLAGKICNYHVHIYKVNMDNSIAADSAGEEDFRVTSYLLVKLKEKYAHWKSEYVYDGRSSLFTVGELPLTEKNSRNEPYMEQIIGLANIDDSESANRRYKVSLTLVATLFPNNFNNTDMTVIRALDTCLFSYARWMQCDDNPKWHIVGARVFASSAKSHQLANAYLAFRGYHASMKSCMAGIVLVVDMAVNCFLASGTMIELMILAGNFRDENDFRNACRAGLHPSVVQQIEKVIKNTKILVTHLHHWKKAKFLGPPTNHPDSAFELDGQKVTVMKYFEIMSVKKPAEYKKINFPELPTINTGSKQKPILIPCELISVPSGQSRSQCMDANMTSEMIKIAACRPEERFNYCINGDEYNRSIVQIMQQDPACIKFGLNNVSSKPHSTPALLLPPAVLQYGNGTIAPGLTGTWNIENQKKKFMKSPPNAIDGSYMYGIIMVGGEPRGPWEEKLSLFIKNIEDDARSAGVPLKQGGPIVKISDNSQQLHDTFVRMNRARILIVVLVSDSYGLVKCQSDALGVATQCVKWKTVDKNPRGVALNIMLKINTKLGGTSHTLISRAAKSGTGPTFQDPPNSLSWIFDKPTMLVGIDVSHAEPGSDRQSMAAVVGSMDGRASQYVAHLSAQTCRVEMVSALQEAMVSLLKTFKRKNGKLPSHVIVYRDGVSEGQFDQVIDKELPHIMNALAEMGNVDEVKVTVVICQKGHKTRIVYEEVTSTGERSIINPCPGLVVDATGGSQSITSAFYNEFYLNSHAAIQGTAKPCKYSLIYDEIGFKLADLELLTYWTTYLYARCNKSVSYATPAYYAHWASKRGKDLFAAGASPQTLLDISAMWAREGALSTMFFL